MTKNKFYIITLSLLFALLFNTCKKYPEGGWVSNRIKHLFGKNEDKAMKCWKLKLYEVNGIDSTSFIIAGNGVTSNENEGICFLITNASAGEFYFKTKIYYGFFDFNNIGTGLGISFSSRNENSCRNGVCERNILAPEQNIQRWIITKLTSKEFSIKSEAKNTYKINFAY